MEGIDYLSKMSTTFFRISVSSFHFFIIIFVSTCSHKAEEESSKEETVEKDVHNSATDGLSSILEQTNA